MGELCVFTVSRLEWLAVLKRDSVVFKQLTASRHRLWLSMSCFAVKMSWCTRTGSVLARCWQHRTDTGPRLVHCGSCGMFTRLQCQQSNAVTSLSAGPLRFNDCATVSLITRPANWEVPYSGKDQTLKKKLTLTQLSYFFVSKYDFIC